MAEHKFTNQNNVIWGETFKMSKKVPTIANRIFKTLADAQEYIDDLNDNAIDGIRISIIHDNKTTSTQIILLLWVNSFLRISTSAMIGMINKTGITKRITMISCGPRIPKSVMFFVF